MLPRILLGLALASLPVAAVLDPLGRGVYIVDNPGGVSLIIEALTDNRNRTASDLRFIFTKNGGSLGTPGSVAWQFDRKGVVRWSRQVEEEDKPFADAARLLQGAPGRAGEVLIPLGGVACAGCHVGGISIAGKQAVEEDTDRVKPAFTVGMFEYT